MATFGSHVFNFFVS